MNLALFTAVLEALANFFKWRAVEAEINSRLLVKQELDKVDLENEALQNKISQLRAIGDTPSDTLADLLRNRAISNTNYQTSLSTKIYLSNEGPSNSNK